MSSSRRIRPGIVVAALIVLAAVPAADSKPKAAKPAKTAASVTIAPQLTSATDPQYAIYRFTGKVSSKLACRADRQVAVALSMDGGPGSPDNTKGSFTARDGSWRSVYEIPLAKGHIYTAVASLKRVGARRAGKRYDCGAAVSGPVVVAP